MVGTHLLWRLDMLVYGATPMGIALCRDATLVSRLTCTGRNHAASTAADENLHMRVALICKASGFSPGRALVTHPTPPCPACAPLVVAGRRTAMHRARHASRSMKYSAWCFMRLRPPTSYTAVSVPPPAATQAATWHTRAGPPPPACQSICGCWPGMRQASDARVPRVPAPRRVGARR